MLLLLLWPSVWKVSWQSSPYKARRTPRIGKMVYWSCRRACMVVRGTYLTPYSALVQVHRQLERMAQQSYLSQLLHYDRNNAHLLDLSARIASAFDVFMARSLWIFSQAALTIHCRCAYDCNGPLCSMKQLNIAIVAKWTSLYWR